MSDAAGEGGGNIFPPPPRVLVAFFLDLGSRGLFLIDGTGVVGGKGEGGIETEAFKTERMKIGAGNGSEGLFF